MPFKHVGVFSGDVHRISAWNDPKKQGHFHFQLESSKGALPSMLLLFPRERSCLGEGGVNRNFLKPWLSVLSFSVTSVYLPYHLVLPPDLPMTCSAKKHSEIFYSSFSECVFQLDTQTKDLFHSKVKKKYVP